jgi:hypothetical protein
MITKEEQDTFIHSLPEAADLGDIETMIVVMCSLYNITHDEYKELVVELAAVLTSGKYDAILAATKHLRDLSGGIH